MNNPLTNGKIVATNYDSRLYTKQDAKRGDPEFVMSRSQLVEFAKCPSRWVRGYGHSDEETTSTTWGSLIDCLLFEPNRFEDRFAIEPLTYEAVTEATKTKAASVVSKPWNNNANVCKEWKAQQGGKFIISRRDQIEAEVAIRRMQEDEIASPLFSSSDFQVYATAEYHDAKTGLSIPVKALIDIVPKAGRYCNTLKDFKTARNGALDKWGRVIYEHRYDVQGAMFLDVYNAATGEDRSEFAHLIQENFAPYEISRATLSDDFLGIGRSFYVDALKRYALCLKTGHWASYNDASRTNVRGWAIVSPEAYMVDCPDPDWLSEEKEAA